MTGHQCSAVRHAFAELLSDGAAKFKLHSDADIEPEIDRRNVLFMCAVNQQILACYYIWRIACFANICRRQHIRRSYTA